MKRILIILSLFIALPYCAHAQFSDSTSGLLSLPSAEMLPEGTVSITNLFLNKHNLCPPYDGWHGWEYNTFAYGFGITFWSRLEVNFICTLFNGAWSKSGGQPDWFFNQDRHFSAKFLLLHEGDYAKWVPAVAVGISDPVTGAGGGNYFKGNVSAGNGYFNRMYVALSKQVETHVGRIDFARGPAFGIAFSPCIMQNDWFSPKFILEYDSRYVNVGFLASVWKKRFEAMFELQNFRWVTFGLRYNIYLLKG